MSANEPTPATLSETALVQNHIDQNELDQLLLLNGFLQDDHGSNNKSLVEEIEDAVLDSGKLSLREWVALRDRLKQIERLIPHIDLIIQLKSQRRRSPSPPASAASPAGSISERLRAAGKAVEGGG